MDNIRIKDHPPWYARGTPVINTRDGPAMALNDKLLFAICRGPSGEGRGGGGSQQLAVGSWQSEDGSQKTEVGRQKKEVRSRQLAVGNRNPDSYRVEVGSRNPDSHRGEVARLPARQHQYGGNEISRGKPMGKTRRWLTLKTTFFNMQNSVFSQWYGVLGRKTVVVVDADRSGDAVRSEERSAVDFDLSACGAPDNVKWMMEDNVNGNGDDVGLINAVKSEDVDRLEDADRLVVRDLSACAAPDNVKIMMKYDNVKILKNDYLTTNFK